jgi:hypothetical protein
MAAAVLCAAVCLAAAGDFAGKWRAEFTTPDGTVRVNTFTFKVDGDKVTGTVAGGQDEAPIKDVKLAEDTIAFTSERQWGVFHYKGKISGDEIRFTVQVNDNNMEMTAKRMK